MLAWTIHGLWWGDVARGRFVLTDAAKPLGHNQQVLRDGDTELATELLQFPTDVCQFEVGAGFDLAANGNCSLKVWWTLLCVVVSCENERIGLSGK